MKVPTLNKFYSVNTFIYAIITEAVFTFLFYLPFWDSQIFYDYFDYLFWLSLLLGIILFFSGIIVYITIFAIPIELILYKLKKIERKPVLISIRFQIIIWFIVLLSLIYSYWFDTYCYPTIEQQLMLD